MSTFLPWRVAHHDLRDPLPCIEPERGRGGIYLVLWWNRIPLGHLEIAAGSMPIPPRYLEELVVREIAPAVGWHLVRNGFEPCVPGMERANPPPDLSALMALNDPLAALERRWAERRGRDDACSISVVVCTRERPEPLDRCLRSIMNSDAPPGEVLVVDNSPRTDRTRALVERLPGVRYCREPRPGLNIARNTGIRASRGEIIAFTDDDVVVHPTWTLEMSRAFADPVVMCVTGLVFPAALDTEAQWIFEKGFGGFNRGYRGKAYGGPFYRATRKWGAPVWTIGAGANMGIRRSAFAEVGLFDERLDAGRAGCSGDSELWYRLVARSLECRYDPVVVVHHEHRRDLDTLDRQMFHYIRGHVAALLVQHANHGDRGNLRRLLASFPVYFLKLAAMRLVAGRDERVRGLGAAIRGWFSGIGFYLRNRGTGAGHRGDGVGPGPDGARPEVDREATAEPSSSAPHVATPPSHTRALTSPPSR